MKSQAVSNIPQPQSKSRAVTINKNIQEKKIDFRYDDPINKNIDKDKDKEKDIILEAHTGSKTTSALASGSGNVNVVCRFRPLNEKEKNISAEQCCEFLDPQRVAIKSSAESNKYKFSFDRIFDTQSTQQEVYEYSAKSIVESVLEGFNGTILAYGQTSSGKTHTMQGVIEDLDLEGIIPRMIRHIFDHILNSSADLEFTVKVSMIEIYQEKLKDLIDVTRTNLNVREDKTKGLYIEDLSEHYVACEEEVLEIMKIGSDNRSIGATNMNEHSSRSHSIFIMTIHQNNIKDLSAKTGKLYLVDLAGSEKISKTGATGLTLEEAKTINKSLTTLGMVINSLTDGKSSHVPYRESKLTRVLQESLGGNSKTCLIITCSPSVYNDAETLSTLRFGLRAKKIKNKPKINKEVTTAELKIEIEKLEDLLDKANKRIRQLENFIKNNNLSLPKDEEKISLIINNNKDNNNDYNNDINTFSKIEVETQLENTEIEKEKLNFDNEDILTEEKKNKHIFYAKPAIQDSNTPKFRKTIGLGLLTEQLKHEREYNKLQENKIENLIYDKKNLNEKLCDTLESLNALDDYPIERETKEKLISEISMMKQSYEDNERELLIKIESLEKLLEEEKKIHRDISIKNNTASNHQEYTRKSEIFEDELNISRRTIKVDEQTILRHMTDEGEEFENFYNNSTKKENENINIIKNSLLNEFFSKLEQSFSNTVELPNIISKYKSKFVEFNFNTKSENIETGFSGNKSLQEEYRQEFENILEEERRKYENEKKVIMKALEDKSEKLCQFEVENKDIFEKLKNLETKINSEDKPNFKKILILEKNLEQLNKMFQHAMAQKSSVIIDKESLENKIKKKNDRMNLLEKELNELKDQIRARDEKLSFMQTIRGTFGKTITTANNVVRIIKGVKQNAQILNGDINYNLDTLESMPNIMRPINTNSV